jgi:hypothetical protein
VAKTSSLRPLAWAAALAAAVFVLVPLALSPGAASVPPAPTFLAELLGPLDASAPLVRSPAEGVRVELTAAGYNVEHGGASIGLAAENEAGSAWQTFAGGVSRSTPFGLETITVEAGRTEQYLTVTERQGLQTWRWKVMSDSLVPRLTENGAIHFFAGARPAPLRIAPVEILDAGGKPVTPPGLQWTLARDAGGWWLELTLDDAALPLPYVIDPAVDYPSPLYLSNASSSATGSWNLVGTSPLLPDSTTRTSLCQNCAGYVQWQPGVDSGVAATPSSTPTGRGWIASANGATAFPAGSWSFTVRTDVPDVLLTPGQAILAVGVWKGRVSGGVFSPTQTLLAPTDDPAAQDLRTSVLPVTTTVTYSLPEFALAASETLYVEYWRKQVAGIDDVFLTRRSLDFIVNDGVARIAHPPADDTPPAAPTQSITESSAASFVSGSTLYYRPNGGLGGVTFTVASSTSDGGSGIAKVTFPGLAGGMTPITATDDTTSPYGQTYSWAFGATESGTKTVTAYDNAGNSSTGTFEIVRDAASPVDHSVTLSSGPVYTTPSVPLVLSNGSDGGGAGVNPSSGSLGRDSAPLVGGACGTFSGTWFGIALTGGVDTGVRPGNCYRYRYMVTDNVGNNSAWSTPSADAVVVNSGVGFHASSSAGTTGGSSLTLNYPAGTVVNDLLLAQVTVRSTSVAITGPAGWTFVRRDNAGSGSNQLGQAIYYKFAGPSEPVSYTWTFSGPIDASGGILAEPGVSPTSPVDVSGGLTGSGTSVTAPSVTTTSSGDRLVGFFGVGSSTAYTPPAAMTEHYDRGGGQTAVSAADENQALAGASGTRTATAISAASSSPNIGQLVALRKDATPPPAPTVSLGESAADAFASGSTVFYRPAGTGSFTVNASASDGESGLQAIVLPGLGAGFTPTVAAAATARTYSWTSGASEAGAKTVTAYDNAGNTSSATFTITPDSTAPTGGSVNYPDGEDADGVVTITTTDGSDAGAGLAAGSGVLERQTAVYSGGTCEAFGSWLLTTSPDVVAAGTCARYRYRVFDSVGNDAVYTSANIVTVGGAGDLTPPTAPLLTLGEAEPDEHVVGSTLFYNPSGSGSGSFSVEAATSDLDSGIASVVFPVVFGLDGSTDALVPYLATYSWSTLSTASGAHSVTAVNGAGLTAATEFTVTPDTAGPSVSFSAPAEGAAIREGAVLEAAAFDALAGTADVEFRYCPGAICTWDTATPIGADAVPPYSVAWSAQPADGTYMLVARAVDNVGNFAAGAPITVVVDNADPSSFLVPVEAFSPGLQHFEEATDTLYYNPRAGGGFSLSSAAEDVGSGIAQVDFPRISVTGFRGAAASDLVAPFTSNTYSFDDANVVAPADATIVVTDVAGNSTSETISFDRDTAAPTGGSVTYADGYHPTGSVSVEAANGTDAGVGIDGGSAVLERQTAVLAGGVCGAYGPWEPAVGPDSLPDATCARYRYRISDRVANEALYTSADVVKTDFTPPTAALEDPGAVLRGTIGLASDASDGASGISSLTYQVSPAGMNQWGAIPAGWNTTAVADALYDLRVIATDAAGNSTASPAVEGRRVDNTPPGVALTAGAGYVNASSADPYVVAATSTDADVSSVEFFRCDDASVDCATGGWLSLGVDASAPFVASWNLDPDGNRSLSAIAVDAVGNAARTVVNVTIDRQAPSNGSLAASHAVSNWSRDNTVDITWPVATDAVSGVDGFSYQWDGDPAGTPDLVKDAEEGGGGTTSPPLGDGAWYFHLRTADNAGNWSGVLHAGPFLIDANASTAVAVGGSTLLRPFNLTRLLPISWSGGDDASGIANYDIQYRAAAYAGAFGTPVLWQSATTATSASFTGSPGSTYCFSGRAADVVGNLSSWSFERCTALPLNSASLTSSAGWSKRTGRGYYLRSYSVSSRRGASLARSGVTTRRVAVVVTKCSGCGTLGIYWNGRLLKKLGLAATSTRKRQLAAVTTFASPRSGTVKLVVLSSGKPVVVEGLGVSVS